MADETFSAMLTGGHPNSLGRTVEVVDILLDTRTRLAELFDCYRNSDEVVRLRTSNALKRITRVKPEWIAPCLDRLINEVANIDQASTQWTLATLFQLLEADMSPFQKKQARHIMQNNLAFHGDWIVLNTTMQTLAEWAASDAGLKSWLLPQLDRLEGDKRGSVSRKAAKMKTLLTGEH